MHVRAFRKCLVQAQCQYDRKEQFAFHKVLTLHIAMHCLTNKMK